MNPKKRNPVWYIACPIVINFAVSFCVQMAAQVIYMMFHVERMMAVMNDTEAMIEWAYTIAAEILQYSTEITGAASLVMIPAALWLFHKDQKEDRLVGKVPPRKLIPSMYGILFVLGVAVCISASNLITLSSVSSLSSTYEPPAEYMYSSPFMMQIICLGIIIPIAEELMMRGLVYKRLSNLLPKKRAMIITALIFSIMQANLVQFIYTACLGLLFAYIYDCYGSLTAPIFIHMVLNLTSVTASGLNLFSWIFYSPVRMAVVTIICAAVGAGMFVVIQRFNQSNHPTVEETV